MASAWPVNSLIFGRTTVHFTSLQHGPRMWWQIQVRFPTEVGPGGRTLWGFALANYSDETASCQDSVAMSLKLK